MHSFITSQIPDFPISPDTLQITGESSITIDQVRDIQHFLSKKPFQSEKNIVVILNAHLLTIPAQNALLKTLEEPLGNSEIYLVTTQPDLLLPTVLSRCQIIKSSHLEGGHVDSSQVITDLLALKTIGDRLLFLDSQSFTRESLGKFLDAFELYIHQNLNNKLIIDYWTLIISSRIYLKSNCNLRLLTTYLSTSI